MSLLLNQFQFTQLLTMSLKNIRLSNSLILLVVLFNSLAASIIIWIFFVNGTFPIFPFFYAALHIVISVLLYEMLFNSELKRYTFIVSGLFLLSMASLMVSKYYQFELFKILTLFTFILFTITVLTSNKKGEKGFESVRNFYAAGIAAFVLNSSAVGILVFGKYIAANSFSVEISNSYIFSTILVTPIFYFGQLIEKLIYTIKKELINKRGIMITAMALLFFLYSDFVIAGVNFFPNLLPDAVHQNSLLKIVPIMMLGSALFSAFHYPLHGILFKELNVKVQKELSMYYFIILIAFMSCGYYLFVLRNHDWLILLLFVHFFLLSLMGVKYSVVRRVSRNIRSFTEGSVSET